MKPAPSPAGHEDSPADDQAICRNVIVNGHRTSMRLEKNVWDALEDIGKRENASLHVLCTHVAARKAVDVGLSAAIRVFTLAYFRQIATEDGHAVAGHGSLKRRPMVISGEDCQA